MAKARKASLNVLLVAWLKRTKSQRRKLNRKIIKLKTKIESKNLSLKIASFIKDIKTPKGTIKERLIKLIKSQVITERTPKDMINRLLKTEEGKELETLIIKSSDEIGTILTDNDFEQAKEQINKFQNKGLQFTEPEQEKDIDESFVKSIFKNILKFLTKGSINKILDFALSLPLVRRNAYLELIKELVSVNPKLLGNRIIDIGGFIVNQLTEDKKEDEIKDNVFKKFVLDSFEKEVTDFNNLIGRERKLDKKTEDLFKRYFEVSKGLSNAMLVISQFTRKGVRSELINQMNALDEQLKEKLTKVRLNVDIKFEKDKSKRPALFVAPWMHYCGEKTDLGKVFKAEQKGEFIPSRVDSICREHDFDYSEITSPEQIRKADENMLNKLTELEKQKDLSILDKFEIKIARAAISTKIQGEDIFNIDPQFAQVRLLDDEERTKLRSVLDDEIKSFGLDIINMVKEIAISDLNKDAIIKLDDVVQINDEVKDKDAAELELTDEQLKELEKAGSITVDDLNKDQKKDLVETVADIPQLEFNVSKISPPQDISKDVKKGLGDGIEETGDIKDEGEIDIEDAGEEFEIQDDLDIKELEQQTEIEVIRKAKVLDPTASKKAKKPQDLRPSFTVATGDQLNESIQQINSELLMWSTFDLRSEDLSNELFKTNQINEQLLFSKPLMNIPKVKPFEDFITNDPIDFVPSILNDVMFDNADSFIDTMLGQTDEDTFIDRFGWGN